MRSAKASKPGPDSKFNRAGGRDGPSPLHLFGAKAMSGVTAISFIDNVSTGVQVGVSATNPLPVTGDLTVVPGPATGANTGTTTSVASAASSTALLAADSTRYGFTVANTDANLLYVLLGTGTASATNYTFTVPPGTDRTVSDYTGAVQGIWAADGSGVALLTVIT